MSIESISLKFKSGNDVPVSEARVTREEWESATAEIAADIMTLQTANAEIYGDYLAAEKKCEELQARVAELEYAIDHAIDYWNRDYNEMAMKDALESMIEILLETKDEVKK